MVGNLFRGLRRQRRRRSPTPISPLATVSGSDALADARSPYGGGSRTPRMGTMGFDQSSTIDLPSRSTASASGHQSPILERDHGAWSNNTPGSFNAGASASLPWLPYERYPGTFISSPVGSSSLALGVNNSSRASLSTLTSPTFNYNQSNMSLVPNSRPSLARQIELDRRKEKTQQILARIEREEDERVQAYRAKVESEQCKIESEGGSASPPSPPRSRQSRGSTSTSLTNQSAQTGSSQDDNLLQRRLPQTLPTADTDNPSNPAPRDVTQRSPGRSRRKGKGIYADVDEFISGLGLYGQRERTRKTQSISTTTLQTTAPSPTTPSHRRKTAPPFPWQVKYADPRPTPTPTATTTTVTTAGNSPGELDGTPILELSAQISIKKQRTRPHQRRQSSPGPMSAGGRPQNYTPYRKPAKDGGMSVQEQQARRVGEKREGHEREMARERVDAVVKGMEMKKMFDPRFVGR